MIKNLLEIYINIQGEDDIIKEIVGDERSYSDNLLLDLGKTAWAKKLQSQDRFDQLQDLVQKLTEAKLKEQNMKEILDGIPDNYLDQLTFEMMHDPIKLPGSDVRFFFF